MKMPKTIIFSLIATAYLLFVVADNSSACGLNWSEPRSYFEGVSFQGYVFVVEPLCQIELRDGRKLPVRAIFRSESNATSPYLGYGWELPILESYIVQLDDRWFRVVEPTGWYRFFWRDEKDPNVLHGQGNWKGVIRENSISVMANCGDRLDFRDGRITSFDLKGKKLAIQRSADGTAALKEGPLTLLEVRKSLSRDNITLETGSDEVVEIGYANRPIIEVIAGQPVVRQQVKSLGGLAKGKTVRTWEYEVDEKLNPIMSIGDRKIVWDPTTRHFLFDGEWTYEVKADEGPISNAAIRRENLSNQTEFWHRDEGKGVEIVQNKDGVKQITRWMTSGMLSGKLRGARTEYEGINIFEKSLTYDENGKLLRFSQHARPKLLIEGELDTSQASRQLDFTAETFFSYEQPHMVSKIIYHSYQKKLEFHFDENGVLADVFTN